MKVKTKKSDEVKKKSKSKWKKEVRSGWKWSEGEKQSENKNIFKLAILSIHLSNTAIISCLYD